VPIDLIDLFPIFRRKKDTLTQKKLWSFLDAGKLLAQNPDEWL